MGAAASAMFILRLELASLVIPDASMLNSTCLWTVTALAAAWAMIQQSPSFDDSAAQAAQQHQQARTSTSSSIVQGLFNSMHDNLLAHPLAIVYLGVVTTAVANYIQTVAQRGVTAERACIIYAMDPVYGAIFAYLLLGEKLGLQGLVGALIVFFAAIINIFFDLSSRQQQRLLRLKKIQGVKCYKEEV